MHIDLIISHPIELNYDGLSFKLEIIPVTRGKNPLLSEDFENLVFKKSKFKPTESPYCIQYLFGNPTQRYKIHILNILIYRNKSVDSYQYVVDEILNPEKNTIKLDFGYDDTYVVVNRHQIRPHYVESNPKFSCC